MKDLVKNLTILGVLTVVTVFSWVILNIIHNLNSSKISEKTYSTIKPISAKFDQSALESLENRQNIQINLSDTIKITPQVTPGLSPTTSPSASPSPSPSPSPSSTPQATPTQSQPTPSPTQVP